MSGTSTGRGGRSCCPDAESNRRVTKVNRDGEAIAVLVHDAAVLDDPGLSDALARAARLAAANARLQAEVQVQVDELGESRRRLVHAGDEERRRLERRLHETVERRLAELAGTLEQADPGTTGAAHLSDVREQLDRALDELHDLATGLRPGGVEPGGLSAALASLAERSPLPVDLRITEVDVAEELERAAYFVCSEALANVIKHAGASSATISVGERAGRLLVEVSDDRHRGSRPSPAAVDWRGSPTASRRSAGHSCSTALRGTGRCWSSSCRSAFRRPDPRQGMSRTGGPTRCHGPPAHTTASPAFIGGSGVSRIVPSPSRANSNVSVISPHSNTSLSPTIP